MDTHLNAAFAALADPTRRAILARLTAGEATVSELVRGFELTQPTISSHLKVLEAAGLISRGRMAQTRPCRLETGTLKAVDGWLENYRRFWEGSFDKMGDYLAEITKGDPMAQQASARKLADDELLITRVFDAPVALVFRIWEKREHMIRWLGPKDFICTHLDLDFRPGGVWRACIVSEAYGENWMGGKFREIEKNKRIVYSFAWEDGRDQPGLDTLITVTFSEEGGKTIQSFHQTPFINVESRDSHIGGWNECFDREQAYAETLAKEEAA